ncbi:MAG: ABC transporter permease [Bacteroidetes bacterium]|nr:ABC transporter permease [Bacteroidota bacterium]
MGKQIPAILEKILGLFLPEKDREYLLGNYEYLFYEKENESGFFAACLWYIWHILKTAPSFIIHNIFWGGVMLKNYLKITWRNFIRYKVYTGLNIFGLAIGLAACILIFLWVQDELSYDKFHSRSGRIFRTEQRYSYTSEIEQWPITSGAFGPTLVEEYPEIVDFTRIWRQGYRLKDYRNMVNQYDIVLTDNSIFTMFDFNLLIGDESTALVDPETVVMTPEKAKLLFGTTDIIGKILPVEWGDSYIDLKVTGLLEPVPHNSHAQFDIVISIATFKDGGNLDHFKWNFLYTYVLLEDNANVSELEPKLSAFMFKHRFPPEALKARGVTEDNISDMVQLKLKPVTSIHLNPCDEWEIGPQGNSASVFMFSAIALLILLIACINFINLSTARAKKKAKEVGMRKAIGAYTHQLWKQFLSESVVITLISLIVALLFVIITLPSFNSISGKLLSLGSIFNLEYMSIIIGVTVLTGLLAGLYPAVYLSSFSPTEIFRSREIAGGGKSVFRRYMVVSQFVISITLIVSTITINNQMEYIQTKSLGFDRENVIVIPAVNKTIRDNYNSLRDKLLSSSGIKYVSSSTRTPGDNHYGDQSYKLSNSDKNINLTFISVDFDFINTYDIQLLAGRSFSREFGTDTTGTLVINEAALRKFEIPAEEMIGSTLNGMKVVGVIKDFHFKSLHKEVEPLVLILDEDSVDGISVRLSSGNKISILKEIERFWDEVNPGQDFRFNFIDERLNEQYAAEVKTSTLFVIFSSLSILVACLGLFGLAAFTTEEKTKEIGVRKVLGASIPNIFLNLVKQFTKWVIVANLIAWPLAYYIMDKWLQNFAYRTEVSSWTFIIAAIVALIIAITTVSFQSVKAALANPIKSLKYE